MPDPYQDPSMSPDSVHVSTYATDKASKHSGFLIEKREFNRFQDDEVPSRAKTRRENHSMGTPVEHEDGDKCWTEQEFEFFDYRSPFFIKKRWVEYWQIDQSLENYYETMHTFLQTEEDGAKDVVSSIKDAGQAAGLGVPSSGLPAAAGIVGTVAAGARAMAPLAAQSIPASAGTVEAGVITAAPAVAATADAAAALVSQVVVPAVLIDATLVASLDIGTQTAEKYVKVAEKISEGWELVGSYYGPEVLEKTGIGVDHQDHPCPKKKVSFKWPLYGWWVIWIVGLLSLIMLVVIGQYLGHSLFTTGTAPVVPPVADTVPPAVLPPVVVAPPQVLQPVISIYGDYDVKVNDINWSDNENNRAEVEDYGLTNGLPFMITTVKGNSIDFQSPMPWWVPVSGELAPDGTFDATGATTAWGMGGLGAEFKGTITPSGLSGEYYVGVKVTTETGVTGRVLPSGRPITFHVDGQLQGAAAPGAAPVSTQAPNVTSAAANPPSAVPPGIDPRLQTFIEQFVPALRNNDTAFLFQHLHPAVLNLYGAAQCQSYVNQRPVDPTYNIVVLDAQGPASWAWLASGITTQVQDVYTLDAIVTVQGQTAKRQVHFGLVGDTVYWFTECGNPLATPIPTQ